MILMKTTIRIIDLHFLSLGLLNQMGSYKEANAAAHRTLYIVRNVGRNQSDYMNLD